MVNICMQSTSLSGKTICHVQYKAVTSKTRLLNFSLAKVKLRTSGPRTSTRVNNGELALDNYESYMSEVLPVLQVCLASLMPRTPCSHDINLPLD